LTTGSSNPVAARTRAANVSATAAAPAPLTTIRDPSPSSKGAALSWSRKEAGAGMMPVTAFPFSSSVVQAVSVAVEVVRSAKAIATVASPGRPAVRRCMRPRRVAGVEPR
jgi:hypothetical protein